MLIFLLTLFACNKNEKNIALQNLPEAEGVALYFYQTRFAHIPDSLDFAYPGARFYTSNDIRLFYRRRLFKPAWTSNLLPTTTADSLIHLLQNARNYGLWPQFYNLEQILKIRNQFQDSLVLYRKLENVCDFEILLSEAVFHFARHLHNGMLPADTLGYERKMIISNSELTSLINLALKNKQFVSTLLGLQPPTQKYRDLLNAYQWFIEHNSLDSLKISIPDPKNDSIRAYQLAREVLVKNGFLIQNNQKNIIGPTLEQQFFFRNDHDSLDAQIEDSLFIQSLRIFQRFNGLNQDGKIGKYTLEALQKSNLEKYWQILLALELLKWENQWPQKYIYVNLPSYKLRFYVNDTIIKEHRVVVGLPANKTPLFTDTMEYFITFPQWNIPPSITFKEIIPKLKRDTAYVLKNNYVVYDRNLKAVNVRDVDWTQVSTSRFEYSFIQEGGNSNSLGTIKFIFPNEHYVYIHDTPSKQYFLRDIRAYSHGCVRLENPWEFAQLLLKSEGRSTFIDTLLEYRKNHMQRHVSLKEPVPVLIRYITVEADNKNNLFFYADVYRYEKNLIASLKKKYASY